MADPEAALLTTPQSTASMMKLTSLLVLASNTEQLDSMETGSTKDSSTLFVSAPIRQTENLQTLFSTSTELIPISVPVTLMTAHSLTAVLVYATGTSTGTRVSTSARGAHTGATWAATATECAKHPNL